jgi:50S ribosomal protein L16 3-hydroxylase
MRKRPASSTAFTIGDFSLQRLLGGLSVDAFLREYWQKKPLLVRQALPGFGNWLDRDSLSALACRDDAESRLVRQQRGRWLLDRGPFEAEELAALPTRGWSLLVSGVNHLLPAGDDLLNHFDFIPRARLDDLMVSFAPKGGGVGPHFDSYDVFLIQGLGSRRWEVSAQTDLEVADGAPLRILKRFTPEQSWLVEAGDLLYLPPHLAHNGVALEDCMTWSVGFKVPRAEEITYQFLTYLQDRRQPEGMFADPGRRRPRHPGAIPTDLLAWSTQVIDGIRWNKADIADFLGRYLSEPKPHIFFDPPARPLSEQAFARAVAQHGVRLSALSQMLFQAHSFFLNGELTQASPAQAASLRRLADNRRLAAEECSEALLPLLRPWYLAGYLLIGTA